MRPEFPAQRIPWPSATTHPGTFTDARFCAPASQVYEAGAGLAHVTPARPDYVFGNYVVGRTPPHADDFDASVIAQVWQQHLGGRPGVQHRILQWEVPLQAADAALRAAQRHFGVDREAIDTHLVLVADRRSLQRQGSAGALTRVTTRAAFRSVEQMALADLQLDDASTTTTDFLDWQYEQFWTAIAAGRCTWWQVENNEGEPRAQCGIALDEGVGRYRDVLTHPAHRQQGWGRALITQTATHLLDGGMCGQLVLIAEAGSVAERLYRSVGFAPVSMQLAVRLAV